MRTIGILAWAWVLVACTDEGGDKPGRNGDDEPTPPQTDDTGDYGSVPISFSATCDPQPDNVLRYDCVIEVEPASEVTVTITEAGGQPVVFESDTTATDHIVTVWGLAQQTDYTWKAWAGLSPQLPTTGEITTGALDPILDPELIVDATGDYGVEHVLFGYACTSHEALLIADTQGRIVWAQDTTDLVDGGAMVRAASVTEQGTILAVLDNDWLVEYALSGEKLLTLSRGAGDFDLPLHHDVGRVGDYTYALNSLQVVGKEPTESWVYDGFYVFDPTGQLVATWDAVGSLDPDQGNPCCSDYWSHEFPAAEDFAHANALGIDPELGVYISYRYIDTVQKVNGDPDDPDFGELEWTLVGDPASPIPTDLELQSTNGATTELSFGSQHHVWRTDRDTVMLYDNRWDDTINSRILEMEIDEASGVADVVAAVDLGTRCALQGSAFELDNGNLLVDCASTRQFLEIEPESAEVLWSMEVRCPVGDPRRPPYRGIPIDLYP